jgi:hypothetical protein
MRPRPHTIRYYVGSQIAVFDCQSKQWQEWCADPQAKIFGAVAQNLSDPANFVRGWSDVEVYTHVKRRPELALSVTAGGKPNKRVVTEPAPKPATETNPFAAEPS